MPKKKCKYKGCKNIAVGQFCIQNGDVFPYCQEHKRNAANACIWDILGAAELSDAELNKPVKRLKTRFKLTPKMKK